MIELSHQEKAIVYAALALALGLDACPDKQEEMKVIMAKLANGH